MTDSFWLPKRQGKSENKILKKISCKILVLHEKQGQQQHNGSIRFMCCAGETLLVAVFGAELAQTHHHSREVSQGGQH